jgi:hypothetical protein
MQRTIATFLPLRIPMNSAAARSPLFWMICGFILKRQLDQNAIARRSLVCRFRAEVNP